MKMTEGVAMVPWLQPEHYQNVLGALILVVVLAMLLERALAVVFEWSVIRDRIKDNNLRVPIAFGASYWICVWGQFDVLSVVFAKSGGYSGPLSFGTFATSAIIAGGSKGAILLFQGVLGFGREAVKARIEAKASPGRIASGNRLAKDNS